MMGALFFFMGIYTLYFQWQWIAYRELQTQRFKVGMRMLDPSVTPTEVRNNLKGKHEEFLTTFYEEEEEEDDEEEEEEEEEEENEEEDE